MTQTQQNGAFTYEEQKQLAKQHDPFLMEAVAQFLGEADIWDFGCGDGKNVQALRKLRPNRKVSGIEGSPVHGGSVRPIQWDLTYPLWLGEPRSVLCLEVGEHIPPEKEEVFLDNLARNCYKRMVLSWGIPGQKGTRHVNCRENKYVIRQLWERGFIYLPARTAALREASNLPWFRHTLLAFQYCIADE